MAFSNIESSEKLEIIDIAIVENEEFKQSKAFKETFETLSNENNEDRLFNTKYVTEEDAKKLLEDGEIVGYLLINENEPKLIFQTSGINETIFKEVVEEISQTEEIMKNVSEKKIEEYMKTVNPEEIQTVEGLYQKIYQEIADIIENQEVKLNNISNSNLSYTMIEFYTLIAMSCLYGGMLGMVAINKTLANMSNQRKKSVCILLI